VKRKFGASSTLLGLIFSITSIVQFLTCPLVGPLSRAFSRLVTLMIGLVVLAAGALLFGMLDSIPGFIIGRLLQGIGNGFLEVSGLSLLMRFSTDLRRDIGLLEGASGVGSLLGPLIGGFLSARLGFRALFGMMTAPLLALILLLWIRPGAVLPPEPSREGPVCDMESDGEGGGVEEEEEEEGGREGMEYGERRAVRGVEMVPLAPGDTAWARPDAGTDGGLDGGLDAGRATASEDALPLSPTFSPPPVAPSAYESFAATSQKLFRALLVSPTLPLYIAAVLILAGGLSFMDTSLTEHLMMATGVTSYTAGLLFTVQVGREGEREGGRGAASD
jgi:MFS family permease